MTPAELNIYIKADAERRERAAREKRSEIYSLAALIRSMVWSKHPPSYEKAFPETARAGKKQKAMTDEEMLSQVRALNALFGGKEVI